MPEEPDVIIVEVGDDEEDGRSLGSEIPLDTSGQDEFGPRLPKGTFINHVGMIMQKLFLTLLKHFLAFFTNSNYIY